MSLSYEEALGRDRDPYVRSDPRVVVSPFSPEPQKCPGCCEKMDEIQRLERHIKSLKTQLRNARKKLKE